MATKLMTGDKIMALVVEWDQFKKAREAELGHPMSAADGDAEWQRLVREALSKEA